MAIHAACLDPPAASPSLPASPGPHCRYLRAHAKAHAPELLLALQDGRKAAAGGSGAGARR